MVNRKRTLNDLLVSGGNDPKFTLQEFIEMLVDRLEPLLQALDNPAEFSTDPEDIAALLHSVGLMQEDNR